MNLSLYSFNKSILNDSPSAIDSTAPVTFLTWFSQKNLTSFDPILQFDQYKNYVIEWGKKKGRNTKQSTDLVRDSYIQLLREIIIDYSTEEERRFIVNADFNNTYDLDVILPFFIQKLKAICLFYVEKRQELPTASIQHNLRGSNLGIENLVKKLIFDSARVNIVQQTSEVCIFPPVSAIAKDLSVYIEELYDQTDNYFNLNEDPNNFISQTTQRALLSSTNINLVNSKFYLDFKGAIIDAIREYSFYLTSLGTNNFSINPELDGSELYYLKSRDFISYLSGGQDQLKINLLKTLAPKYIGTDFHFLSTGTTATNFVSGILFKAQQPTLNILNKQYPTVATVQNLNSLFSDYEIGRFFVPQHQGLLIHNTPYKTYEIDTSKLSPNTVYAYPDPDIIGNTSWNNDVENEFAPVLYKIDLTWNKISRANQYAFGDVLSNSYNQLYYSYQSQSQDQQKDITGLTRSYDNVQFWDNKTGEIWENSDLWPGLNQLETFTLDERQYSILSNDLTPVYRKTDIFGNEYGLLKRVYPLKTQTINNSLTGTNTVTIGSQFTEESVFSKKYEVPGTLIIRDVYTNKILPASASLSAIFVKYPDFIRTELDAGIYYFSLYNNVIIIETENYLLVDSINYDFDVYKIVSTPTPGNYFKKYTYNSKLEKFIGEWYVEADKTLYFAFTKLLPALSATNFKSVYPYIIKTKTDAFNFVDIFPEPGTDLSKIYSLSAGLETPPQHNWFKIDGGSFYRNEKNNIINIGYIAKNLNDIPFFVTEQFNENEPYITSLGVNCFKPYYYIYDLNYNTLDLRYVAKYNASSSGTAGTHLRVPSIFDVGQYSKNDPVYLYSDGYTPLQINKPGNYIIQFDWQSYEEASIFIGCSGLKVRKLDIGLVWNVGTSNAVLLSSTTQQITGIQFNAFVAVLSSLSAVSPAPITTGILLSSITAPTNILSATNLGIPLSTFALGYNSFAIKLFSDSTLYVASSAFLNDQDVEFRLSSNIPSSYTVGTPLSVFAYSPFTIQTTDVIGIVKRPEYSDEGILSLTLTPKLTSYEGPFCAFPDSIYYNIAITKTGAGSGTVFTDPPCLFCGDVCDAVFGYGTTVTVIPSANYFSRFVQWIGGPCSGESSSCSFNVTTNYAITAVFDIIPFYNIEITTLSRVLTLDLGIDCGYRTGGTPGNCSNLYLENTVLFLSAVQPMSGYRFYGFAGNPCVGVVDTYCIFNVTQNYSITANFARIIDYGLYTAVVPMTASGPSTLPFNLGRIVAVNEQTGLPNLSRLSCPSTCFTTYSGIGGYLGTVPPPFSGETTILCAAPTYGYRLLGFYSTIFGDVNTLSAEPFNRVTPSILTYYTTKEERLSAVFDVRYWDLTIVVSGSGAGRIFADNGLFNDPYNNTSSGSITYSYPILSGTNVSMYASAAPFNTVHGIFNTSCGGDGVTACSFKMNEDRTVFVTISSGIHYLLRVIPYGVTCTDTVTSDPFGINCGSDCTQWYASGTRVDLGTANISNTCQVTAFYGDQLYYLYTAGPGISTNPTVVELLSGEIFDIGPGGSSVFYEGSLSGAPYFSSATITVEAEPVRVYMLSNRTVSAQFVNI